MMKLRRLSVLFTIVVPKRIWVRQKEDGESYEDVIDIYFKGISKIFFED